MRYVSPIVAAIVSASGAHATIEIAYSNSAYFLTSDIQGIAGEANRLPRDEEVVSLLDTSSVERTRQLSSTVTNGSLTSWVTGTDTLTRDAQQFGLSFAGETRSEAQWSLDQSSALDVRGESDHRNVTRFTTDQALSVALSGVGTRAVSDAIAAGGGQGGAETPFRLWVRLYEEGNSEAPVYETQSALGDFAANFTIDPGTYLFHVSVLSWLELDTLVNGDGTAFDSSSLSLNASFITIPAPATTLLFPLTAAFSTRRRR